VKYMHFIFAMILLPMFLLSGCSTNGQTDTSKSDASSAYTQPEGQSEEMIKLQEVEAASLRIEEVRQATDSRLLTTTGKIGFNEDRISHVVAPTSGYILDLKAKVGDQVKEGQTLALIKSKELAEAIADFLASKKDLELAQKSYTMTKDLFEHEAASRMSFQQAENDLAKARMQTERNSEKLRIMGVPESQISDASKPIQPIVPIKSPINGVITERQATPAQYVAADGAPLFTIADLSTVWVLGDVFEKDMRLLKPNQRAQVVTPAFPNSVFAARVSRIDTVLDPASRTVKVRSVVTNVQGRLRPEMFATVTFFLAEADSIITVPSKAVLTESGSSFVYLAKPDNTFVRQKVDVQPGEAGRLRLISGLNVGDRIVSDGTILLRAEEDKKGDK